MAIFYFNWILVFNRDYYFKKALSLSSSSLSSFSTCSISEAMKKLSWESLRILSSDLTTFSN